MTLFYTGVGSRQTPQAIQGGMAYVAQLLSNMGWVLRSGGAIGADKAFQTGAKASLAEIYRPLGEQRYPTELWEQAMQIAASTHPAWNHCSDYAKALHTRNVFQVLGGDLNTPSRFVLCWTPDGAEYTRETSRATGGTGTAIRIADMYGVPVFNLANQTVIDRMNRWLG